MAIGAPSGWHDIWGGSKYNTSVVGMIVDDRNLTDGSGALWKLLVNGESMAVWYELVGERRGRLHVHTPQLHASSPNSTCHGGNSGKAKGTPTLLLQKGMVMLAQVIRFVVTTALEHAYSRRQFLSAHIPASSPPTRIRIHGLF